MATEQDLRKRGEAPSGLKCPIPTCGEEIAMAKNMISDRPPSFRKGMIMVCNKCTTMLILGDTNLRPLSKEEFQRLDPHAQRALKVIVGQLRIKRN